MLNRVTAAFAADRPRSLQTWRPPAQSRPSPSTFYICFEADDEEQLVCVSDDDSNRKLLVLIIKVRFWLPMCFHRKH